MRLAEELRRRNVIRVAVAYAVVSWIIVQVVVAVEAPLNLPDWFDTGVILLLAVGFVVAVLLAWAFELTPEGVRRAADVEPAQREARSGARKLDYLIIAGLSVALALVVVDSYVLDRPAGVPAANRTAPAKSVAVLPFVDLSPGSDQEHFADGLTEELLNKLAQIDDLRVVGRTSSFYFKGRNVDLREIGSMLGVTNVLEGSVRKAGNDLRITAQLIDTADGYHLWSETYDRELADMFAIQDEIGEAVAQALAVRLGAGGFDEAGGTRSVEAFEELLQGGSYIRDFQPEALDSALDHLERAVAIDPEFGAAWLGLAQAYGYAAGFLPPSRTADFEQRRQDALARARAVAPAMPELVLADADAELNAGNWLEAERILLDLLEPDGRWNARANLRYGVVLLSAGRAREALPYLEQAQRLEPLAIGYLFRLAENLLVLGRGEEAVALAERGLELGGSEFLMLSVQWHAAAMAGDLEQAAGIIREFDPESVFAEVLAMADTEAALARLEQEAQMDRAPAFRFGTALWAAVLGDPRLALELGAWREQFLYPDMWFPLYAQMRALPEFKVVVRDNGLHDYWRATGEWGDFCRPLGADFECE